MSNSIIRAELETKLKVWADSQIPTVPIAFQDVAFIKPSNGSTYLEPFLIPSTTFNREVSGKRKTHIGIFQVNCWAQSGKGAGEVERLSHGIVDLFPIFPKTGSVSIEQTPSAERAILDTSGWIVVPVTIKYRMETF